MWIYLVPLKCTVKYGWIVHFIYYVTFTTIKNKIEDGIEEKWVQRESSQITTGKNSRAGMAATRCPLGCLGKCDWGHYFMGWRNYNCSQWFPIKSFLPRPHGGCTGGHLCYSRQYVGWQWQSELALSYSRLHGGTGLDAYSPLFSSRISNEHSPKLQIRSHSYLRAVSEVSINRSLDSLDPAGLLTSPKFRSRNESYMRAMSTISQVSPAAMGTELHGGAGETQGVWREEADIPRVMLVGRAGAQSKCCLWLATAGAGDQQSYQQQRGPWAAGVKHVGGVLEETL